MIENIFKLFCSFLIIVIFFGCEEKKDYGNIHYDRNTCEYCKMVVSDKNFAVDMIYKQNNYYFDDIGCLVEWAIVYQKIDWIKESKIYVNDASGKGFIDAKTAFWYHGYITPMAFGYAAFLTKQQSNKESIDFNQVLDELMMIAKERIKKRKQGFIVQ